MRAGQAGRRVLLQDLEKVSVALAKMGVEFEPENPVSVLPDLKTGKIKDSFKEIRDERPSLPSSSARCPWGEPRDLRQAQEVAGMDTVFSLNIINKCRDGTPPLKKILDDSGIHARSTVRPTSASGGR